MSCNPCNDPFYNTLSGLVPPNGGDCAVSPCSQVYTVESLASAIQNLETNLFGVLTMVVTQGRGVWSQPCSPLDAGLSTIPRQANEGLICYLLRVLPQIGVFVGGIYNPALAYNLGSIVAYGISLYYATVNIPVGGVPGVNPGWQLLITAPAGPPGSAGSGSAINFNTRAVTSAFTLTNTDAELYCKSGSVVVGTIPLMSGLLAGKWFTIFNEGTANITVTPTPTDVIGLPGTAGTSTYTILPGDSLGLSSRNLGFWYVR